MRSTSVRARSEPPAFCAMTSGSATHPGYQGKGFMGKGGE